MSIVHKRLLRNSCWHWELIWTMQIWRPWGYLHTVLWILPSPCMCRNNTDLGTNRVNLMNGPYVVWIIWASCEFLSSEKVHVWDSHGIANTFYFKGRRKSGYERRTKVCHSERSFTYFFAWDASFRMCSQLVTTPNHELLKPHERNFRVIEFYFASRIVLSDFRFQKSYMYRTRLVCGWELNWSPVI